MLDGRFRSQIETWVRPVGMSVKRAGIPADAITCVGLAMSVGCAVAIASGSLTLGFLLLILTGIPDTLDGAVAKASGTSSERGAFFDSVSDRVTDALVFGGLAWHFSVTSNGLLPVLAFAAFVTSVLPSYIRAKAEALGLKGGGGLVERAERFIILGLGLLFAPLLVASLFVMIALNLATAAQRFVHVWHEAAQPVTARSVRPARRRSQGTSPAAERWKARRADARARARDRRSA